MLSPIIAVANYEKKLRKHSSMLNDVPLKDSGRVMNEIKNTLGFHRHNFVANRVYSTEIDGNVLETVVSKNLISCLLHR